MVCLPHSSGVFPQRNRKQTKPIDTAHQAVHTRPPQETQHAYAMSRVIATQAENQIM